MESLFGIDLHVARNVHYKQQLHLSFCPYATIWAPFSSSHCACNRQKNGSLKMSVLQSPETVNVLLYTAKGLCRCE